MYLNAITNEPLAKLYEDNAKAVGVKFDEDSKSQNAVYGSTDMGNVSYVVPSIHPIFYIGSKNFNHTREFTEAVGECYNTLANYHCAWLSDLLRHCLDHNDILFNWLNKSKECLFKWYCSTTETKIMNCSAIYWFILSSHQTHFTYNWQ